MLRISAHGGAEREQNEADNPGEGDLDNAANERLVDLQNDIANTDSNHGPAGFANRREDKPRGLARHSVDSLDDTGLAAGDSVHSRKDGLVVLLPGSFKSVGPLGHKTHTWMSEQKALAGEQRTPADFRLVELFQETSNSVDGDGNHQHADKVLLSRPDKHGVFGGEPALRPIGGGFAPTRAAAESLGVPPGLEVGELEWHLAHRAIVTENPAPGRGRLGRGSRDKSDSGDDLVRLEKLSRTGSKSAGCETTGTNILRQCGHQWWNLAELAVDPDGNFADALPGGFSGRRGKFIPFPS